MDDDGCGCIFMIVLFLVIGTIIVSGNSSEKKKQEAEKAAKAALVAQEAEIKARAVAMPVDNVIFAGSIAELPEGVTVYIPEEALLIEKGTLAVFVSKETRFEPAAAPKTIAVKKVPTGLSVDIKDSKYKWVPREVDSKSCLPVVDLGRQVPLEK
jgi:hypothetical protein